MSSTAARLENIKANANWPQLQFLPREVHNLKASLICYGPSLRDTWTNIDPESIKVTVSGAHDYLLSRGIVPDAHVEFDPRPHKAKHIAIPSHDTVYYLASCVHPDVFEVVKDRNIFVWHAKQTKEENALAKASYYIPGGSSVGLRAIELLYALGYRDFDIHGMDSSFTDARWAGEHHGNNNTDAIPMICAGRRFDTSIAFMYYAQQFLACRDSLRDAKFNLFGVGLIQWMAHNMKQENAA